MRRSVFLSTFLFAAVLGPVVLQGRSCMPPEAAGLAALELHVGDFSGENVIEGFNSDVFSYEARFPDSESVAVLWVRAQHPSQELEVFYDGFPVKLLGQSVAELEVPFGSSELTIDVSTRQPPGDSSTYVVRIERVPVFPCTEQGIRDAIAYGGGPNYFDCDGPTVVPTEAEIVIDNDVILDGEGNLIVDAGGGGGTGGTGGGAFAAPKANGAHRVFSIPEGVTVEMIGFTVSGGSTDSDGGGILNAGTLTLTSSTVTRNTADVGAGIRNLETATLSVIDSVVSENTATSFGGGIHSVGFSDVIDSTVSNNTAMVASGGVSNRVGATMTLTRTIVQGNSAATVAGGLANRGTVNFSATVVSDNQAGTIGGGVVNRDVGVVTMTDSTVSGNTAAGDGGGIFNEGTFTLANSTVSDNSADRGGGVASFPPGMLTVVGSTVSSNTANLAAGLGTAGMAEVIDTTVSGNTALIAGGGVGVAMGGALTMSGCVVEGNSAADGAGGLGSEADTTVTLNNTTISGNEAGNIGGGVQTGGTLTLNGSTITRNVAVNVNGGGLWNGDTGIVTLHSTTMSENTAAIFGGAVDNFGSLTLVDSAVSGNVSRDGGGGIFNEAAGILTLQNSTVSGNATTVGAGGGILQVSSQPAAITDSAIIGNESPDVGGGIASGTGSVLSMSNTTVSQNTAFEGGGVWGAGPSLLTITGSTVSGNVSTHNGGGITSFGHVTLIDSSISGNNSGSGGGMYVGHSGVLMIENSTLSGNATEGGGGAIDVDGSVTVTNSTISGNIAERGGGGIFNQGLLEIFDTTVSNNTARVWSGGISNGGGGILMLMRSTVAGNSSVVHSGGIGNSGTAILINATVSQNESDLGGGIRNYVFGGNAGTITVVSTTVSGNVAPSGAAGIRNESEMTLTNSVIHGDCRVTAPLLSLGGNIESPGDSCSLVPGIDLPNVPPGALNLGPLANNGGPTQTHALLPGSVAIDWVPVGQCVDANGFPLLTDQRGVSRPQGPACDSGAFELEAAGPIDCIESQTMCMNGSIDPITPCCEVPAPPAVQPACDGTESLLNPVSCTATGTSLPLQLTVLEIAGDCNLGYDLDECFGQTCIAGGLAPGEGVDGVDNALAGLAPVLAGVGGNLGGVNQAFSDAICGLTDTNDQVAGCETEIPPIDVQFVFDVNVEENCANVGLVADGANIGSVILNIGDPTAGGTVCASGTLGTVPIKIAGQQGALENAVVQMTVSEGGFSDGLLGATVDADTAVAIAEALLEGAGAVVGQVFDINDSLVGNNAVGCNALSGSYWIGGTVANGTPPLEYTQDFESLDQASPTALGDDGWLIYGSVFEGDGTFKFGYGPFPAPNAAVDPSTTFFSAIVTGEGSPGQGAKQLLTLNDYNCCDLGGANPQGHGNGTDLVESNVFQEPFGVANPIQAGDVGKTARFSFDAKRGNINDPADPQCAPPEVCDSTALAFLRTLDPDAGFALTNDITEDTTNLPDAWARYSIELEIDPSLVGQILQFGFANRASSFEPSGVLYDNVVAVLEAP